MSERGAVEDPLAGWDPRRRASLERIWQRFRETAGDVPRSDELMVERRQDAGPADRAGLREEDGVRRAPLPDRLMAVRAASDRPGRLRPAGPDQP